MGERTKPEDQDKTSEKLEHPELNMGEAGISVSLTSFMTAVTFFFVGLLLTGSAELQIRLRVPLALLFISAFGFLYSTLIYTNASGEISRLRKQNFSRQMQFGNIISEYFGVYCLVFAAPIIILGYSPDRVLAVIVLITSIGGFLLYHYFGYSILERYIKRRMSFFLTIILLLSFHSFSFWTFFFGRILLYYLSSLLLIFMVFGLAAYSGRRKEL